MHIKFEEKCRIRIHIAEHHIKNTVGKVVIRNNLVDMLGSCPGEAACVVAADHVQGRGVGMAACACAIHFN